jgi:hypothetical protein
VLVVNWPSSVLYLRKLGIRSKSTSLKPTTVYSPLDAMLTYYGNMVSMRYQRKIKMEKEGFQ